MGRLGRLLRPRPAVEVRQFRPVLRNRGHRESTILSGRGTVRQSLLLLFISMTAAGAWAGTTKSRAPQARIGELLLAAESLGTIVELDDGGKPKPGFHYVRVTGTITNVGKHAICADIQAFLETTFNLESFGTFAKFDDKPWSRIDQMLPGEHIHAEFTFTVKNGVQPLTLVFKQPGIHPRQGCSKKEPLPITNSQVSFPVSSIEKMEQQDAGR